MEKEFDNVITSLYEKGHFIGLAYDDFVKMNNEFERMKKYDNFDYDEFIEKWRNIAMGYEK